MFTSGRRRLPRLGRWPRLALAGICLLLAGSSALSAHAQAQTARAVVPVVVAVRTLPAGRVLARSDLAVVSWPKALRPLGARARRTQVIGRRLSGPMARNEAVTTARLLGRDATSGLPAGTTAVPVTIADQRLGDIVHAGDRVDLLAAGTSDALDSSAGGDAPSDAGDPVALAVRVLTVLPLRDDAGTELVVAADVVTAERIVRLAATQVLTAVGIPP